MKVTGKKSIVFAAVLCCIACVFMCGIPAKAADGEKFAAVYNVKKKPFGAKSGKDSTEAIQKALDKAAKKGKANKRAQVYIPAGTYYISKTLQINSNTYLKCDKSAKIVKKSKNVLYMLRTAKNGKKGKKGYGNVRNVTVDGGVWDAKYLKFNKDSGGSLFFFVHSQNLEFVNLTLRNNYGTHLLELGGDKDVAIKKCRFYGFKESASNDEKEAIQLDVCHNYTILPDGMPYDDTPCMNVTIEDNEIYGYPRAIGSHSYVKGIYPSNIEIRNNYIHDISQNAIYAYNYRNLTVEGNTFDKVYAAVVFKSYATEGKNTIFNRNNGVKAMSIPGHEYNLVIKDNKINTTNKSVGRDAMQLGVFIYGTNDYMINNVTVENNTIKSASTGIYMRYVDNSVVSGNVCSRKNGTSGKFVVDAYKFLSCSSVNVKENTVKYDNYMYENGFAFRERSTSNTLQSNTVERVSKHGIGMYSDSSAEVTDNTINKAGQHGITIMEKSEATLKGNSINDSAVNGIIVLGSKAVIDSNNISKAGQHGISVMEQADVTVNGNTILQSAVNGITVLGAGAAIDNNTIKACGQTGLSIQDGASVSSVQNNIITGHAGKAVAINGSTAKNVKGNTLNIVSGDFVLTAVDSDTNVESLRASRKVGTGSAAVFESNYEDEFGNKVTDKAD